MNRQFPPEIVQLIVEASLDPYDLFTASSNVSATRYAVLRSFTLLNSTWYGASQPELVRSVVLRMDESVKDFLELAQRRGGTVEGVRDLWIDGIGYDDFLTLPNLFKSTPHLLNLYCHGGTIYCNYLAQLQRLRRLKLDSIGVAGFPSPSLLCLPKLRQLTMTEFWEADATSSHFLTPTFLPRLRRLEIDDYDYFDRIAPLIQQLEIITFNLYNGNYTLLSPAKSLLLLPLPEYSRDRLAMFTNLPSLPPFLHVNFPSRWGFKHGPALALQQLLGATNPGLRIILLNDDEIDDRVRSLIQRFQERGIRVQMVDQGMDLDGAIEEMYRIRAKEKRAMEDGAGKGG